MITDQWICETCNKLVWQEVIGTTVINAPTCCGGKMAYAYSRLYTGDDAKLELERGKNAIVDV